MIKVFIIDESPIVCRLLTSYLQTVDDIQVVGSANDGADGLRQVQVLRPDVVTLGLEMQAQAGLEILGQLMHDMPTPVVIITGASRRAAQLSLRALQAGAVDFVLKYSPQVGVNPTGLRQEIVAKVRAAAKVRVVRSIRARSPMPLVMPLPVAKTAVSPTPTLPASVLVIGASTGGPVAVRELLEQLPAHCQTAVLVVQHIPATFTKVLAAQLNQQVPLPVREAQAGDRLEVGQVLVVPGDYHLLVEPDLQVVLNQAPKIRGHRPSIDVTMQSVAQVVGQQAKGVVLTGMGEDGTLGLAAIAAKGGRTFAQDSASSVVDGMPQRAREQGVVDFVGTPAEIGGQLLRELIGYDDDEWDSK